jgi:hypothetical protein
MYMYFTLLQLKANSQTKYSAYKQAMILMHEHILYIPTDVLFMIDKLHDIL